MNLIGFCGVPSLSRTRALSVAAQKFESVEEKVAQK